MLEHLTILVQTYLATTPDCEPIVTCLALRLVVFVSLPPTVATLETTPFYAQCVTSRL